MSETLVAQLMLFVVALAVVLPMTWRSNASLNTRLEKALDQRDKAMLDKIAAVEEKNIIQRQLDTLTAKSEATDAKVAALELAGTGYIETISSLRAQLDQLGKDSQVTIGGLETRITGLEATIATLQATITDLTKERDKLIQNQAQEKTTESKPNEKLNAALVLTAPDSAIVHKPEGSSQL